ncbi:MAG: hypothetical protein K5876_00135 [Ruminiclostridium sp.]|nr:hypothetical protein [Ruminiclostridium sp.]
MKRMICLLAAALVCIAALRAVCFAESPGDELYGAVPPEVREVLDESGVTPSGGASEVGLGEILSGLTELVADNIGKPLKMFASMTALILLASILSGVGEAAGGQERRGIQARHVRVGSRDDLGVSERYHSLRANGV